MWVFSLMPLSLCPCHWPKHRPFPPKSSFMKPVLCLWSLLFWNCSNCWHIAHLIVQFCLFMFFYWEEIRSFSSHCGWTHMHLTRNNFSWFDWGLSLGVRYFSPSSLQKPGSLFPNSHPIWSILKLSSLFFIFSSWRPVPWAQYNEEQSRNLMKLKRLFLGWRKGLEMRALVPLGEVNSSGIIKSIGSGVKLGFQSWFDHLLTLVSWTSHVTFLSLGFFIHKVGSVSASLDCC